MTLWTITKAVTMLVPTAIGAVGYYCLGATPLLGLLFVVIIWIQLSTFCQMNENTKVQYADMGDSLHELMTTNKRTTEILRKAQTSETPEDFRAAIFKFGAECFARGAQRERLRWSSSTTKMD